MEKLYCVFLRAAAIGASAHPAAGARDSLKGNTPVITKRRGGPGGQALSPPLIVLRKFVENPGFLLEQNTFQTGIKQKSAFSGKNCEGNSTYFGL